MIEELSMLNCAWKTACLWEGAVARDVADYLDRLPWTEADDERLRELAAAPGANIADLTQAFGRSRSAIVARLPWVGAPVDLPARPQPAP
ncbi:hypothetical protein [Nonomuraea endophytica]|uniref:hypothetical protein n=1 Tax=Nonomuraea endophytica TaxID=714136 RepID=UPI0037C58768